MGKSRQNHLPIASLGWWKLGGEALPKIIPELLTEHWGMANSKWPIVYAPSQIE